MYFIKVSLATLASSDKNQVNFMMNGAVAQLGERSVRNAEVEGSIPFGSTSQFIVKLDD